MGTADATPELLLGKAEAEASRKQNAAFLGYVRGDLLPNEVFKLSFGLQTNDRPEEQGAVRQLASTMSGKTDRYHAQSLLKVPIPAKLLTDDFRAAVAPTKDWTVDRMHQEQLLGKLPDLKPLIWGVMHKLEPKLWPAVPGTEETGDAKSQEKDTASSTPAEEPVDEPMAGEKAEDASVAAGAVDPTAILKKIKGHKPVVLAPVGGQHRTGAVALLCDQYEKENVEDAKKILDLDQQLPEVEEAVRKEASERAGAKSSQLASLRQYESLSAERAAAYNRIASRKRFLLDGGSWLFALYDDGEYQAGLIVIVLTRMI